MMKNIYALFLYAVLTFGLPTPIAQAQSIETSAKQAIVIDYETGTTLFAKNPDEKMPTSSMSKVITSYKIFEALKAGDITLTSTYLVSEEAWRKGGSKMFVEVNKEVSVEDLLRGVIVQSGNDATIVLAEGLSGSEIAFAEELNKTAQELGMTNSHFMNASGWPDPDHYSTARDLSILATALIKNFPEYYPYYAEKEFTYNAIPQHNRNPLLYQNIGADGIKTGHTEDGGYGLMGSAVANGRRVILIMNGLASDSDRAQEAKKLMQWGLERFKNETVFKAGQSVEKAPVVLGQTDSVNLVLKEDIMLTLPRNADKSVSITTSYNSPIKAPVTQGQELGALTITMPGQVEPIIKPLVAGENIGQQGLFDRVLSKAKLLTLGH